MSGMKRGNGGEEVSGNSADETEERVHAPIHMRMDVQSTIVAGHRSILYHTTTDCCGRQRAPESERDTVRI